MVKNRIAIKYKTIKLQNNILKIRTLMLKPTTRLTLKPLLQSLNLFTGGFQYTVRASSSPSAKKIFKTSTIYLSKNMNSYLNWVALGGCINKSCSIKSFVQMPQTHHAFRYISLKVDFLEVV